ncbi:MAG TPA: peptidoglycan bridge formation glycyltransferase FemA/FemB family protein [Candidatus Dormibacteraeota bacterium]|nr:peptidoglycan bridge formation glycyltransferase FemA/FemB family protein [Candidatus Dormibacteraeota bacterium]
MISDAARWDVELERLASRPPLLQSWAWGAVQSNAGWKVQYAHFAGGMASILERRVGTAVEAYVPRGPVPATAEAIDGLIEFAKAKGYARLVVEPEAPPDFAAALEKNGFASIAPTQPQHTRILDLGPPEELLANFKHGRRYNIRAGLKRGVAIEEGSDAGELARQSAAVERRESIHLPDRRYYKLLMELLPWCRTYTARAPQSGEALATVLVARHAGRAYSLFAGRTGMHSELMGNDVAWWAAIAAAATAGCQDFDLWGVPPPGAGPDHPWHGLGFFKAEFGGQEVAYCGAWELVISTAAARLLAIERRSRAFIRGLKRNNP